MSEKNKKDLLTDLSSALTVRAEQIRNRLATERELGDPTAATEDENEEMVQSELLSFKTTSVPYTVSQIPVSQARLRRRQERSKVDDSQRKDAIPSAKSTKHGSTVDIRNYRPGYTWSKGGRLKELRIRCIARKFLLIWQRKTFGRILPYVADAHFQKHLMQKVYRAWYDYWWEIVKEWRLGVRAECHYRYKLWYKIFISWKHFKDNRNVKKDKEAKAKKYCEHCQLKHMWQAWRAYISQRHRMIVLKKRADQFRNQEITRLAWATWQSSLDKARFYQEDLATAIQFWAYRIQAQHWLLWKSAFAERQKQHEKFVDACVHHNSTIVSRCLKAWSLYARNRRVKKAHKEFAVRVYQSQLKLAAFNHWCQRWHVLRSLQQHHMKIHILSHNFRMQWAIWRWRQFVSIQRVKHEVTADADQHYNRQLLRFGMDSFRLNVVHSKIKQMRIRMALQLRVQQLQRSAWRRWMQALDAKEEEKCASETDIAREHYRVNLLVRCFSNLKDYTQWRQLRKHQYARAEAHYYLHTIPKCLFHMRMFVELERKCRDNAQKSQEFYRYSKLEWVFNTWVSRAKQCRDTRMMYRMAVLHRENVVLQSKFSVWRQRLQERYHESDQVVQAQYHYIWSIGCKVWTAWRLLVSNRRTREANHVKAIRLHHLTNERMFFNRWKQKFKESRHEKDQTNKAVGNRNKKILTVCFKQWKLEVVSGRKFRSIANERFSQVQQRKLRSVFVCWRVAAVQCGVVKRKKISATIHHNRQLMLKVVQAWRSIAVLKVYRREKQQQLLKESIAHLQLLKLSLCWKRWLKEKDRSVMEALNVKKSEVFHNKKMMSSIWSAWKDYSKLSLRKRLLKQQSQWFHNVRVSAKCFLLWRHRLEEYQEEKSNSHLALWHWSLILQRKVLIGWLSYVQQRRHKKKRLEEAANVWRQQLLRTACCQWLSTADSLSHMRSVMAARHQVSSAFDSFHLIQRCAAHWKVWARRRAASRGVQVKQDKIMTMTSAVRLDANLSLFPVTHQIYPGQQSLAASRMLQPKPLTAVSPARPQQQQSGISGVEKPKIRLPPKRPAFLVDSLKRAGLFSEFQNSGEPEKSVSELSEVESTPSLSDLRIDPNLYPEYPESERFTPHGRSLPTTQRSRPEKGKVRMDQDWDISGDVNNTDLHLVLSGSGSTIGGGPESVMKPLHLSSSDTEPSGAVTGSSTQNSPHFMFTPSTQRSQFSGNPLLYSSPVSEKNTARETGRATAASAQLGGSYIWPEQQVAYSAGTQPGIFDLNSSKASLLTGNLEGFAGKDTAGLYQTAPKPRSSRDTEQVPGQNKLTTQEAIVLLKPEDFMKKTVQVQETPKLMTDGIMTPPTPGTVESRKPSLKRTPRTYTSQDNDQNSELPPMGDLRMTIPLSQKDSIKDGHGIVWQMPSPRRTAPQGILLTKVSDSDADVSPLNTARSRGTVTFASPKSPSPEEEIINIRDRLRHFSQQKEKLRSLRRQYRQLSDWLAEQTQEIGGGDDDSQSATEELDMLRIEVAELQGVVDSQRPICERLVLRAQTLAKELQMAPA